MFQLFSLLWLDEKKGHNKSKPEFSICCALGKVKLPLIERLPIYLAELLSDSNFISKIRYYNAAFSFLSFQADSDVNLSKNNVYTYRIHGMIHHKIGLLIQSNPEYKPKFTFMMDSNKRN